MCGQMVCVMATVLLYKAYYTHCKLFNLIYSCLERLDVELVELGVRMRKVLMGT